MSGGGDVADADIAYRQHVSMCIARLANYLVLWQIELSCSLATCRELASLLVGRFIMSGDGMPCKAFLFAGGCFEELAGKMVDGAFGILLRAAELLRDFAG